MSAPSHSPSESHWTTKSHWPSVIKSVCGVFCTACSMAMWAHSFDNGDGWGGHDSHGHH